MDNGKKFLYHPDMVKITQAKRWDVWERDGHACQCCGSKRFLSVDHITPLSAGGSDDWDNLQTLCGGCNVSKNKGGACACGGAGWPDRKERPPVAASTYRKIGMDSSEVRRVWLRNGGNLTETGAALGVPKQLISYHVRKANAQNPLTYQSGEPEDQRAMAEYVRACLDRAGIAR